VSVSAVIAPTAARARRAAGALGPVHGDLLPRTIEGFLEDRGAGLSVVVAPDAESIDASLAFLRDVRRRILWPPPSARLRDAIAGLRDEHVAAKHHDRQHGSLSAFLLEGDVTKARARRALERHDVSRDWIVEDVRRVRLDAAAHARVAGAGVRWFALHPVEVVALAGETGLARARRKWVGLVPPGTPLWTLRE